MIMEKMKVTGLNRKQNYSERWGILIKKATDILNKMLVLASNSKCPRNYILDQVRLSKNRVVSSFVSFL